jgi:hypothetical protein
VVNFFASEVRRHGVTVVPACSFGKEIESFTAVVCDADDAAQVTQLLSEYALIYKIVFDDKNVECFGDALRALQVLKIGPFWEAERFRTDMRTCS